MSDDTLTRSLLVTGSSGYIGNHIVCQAFHNGWQVRATTRSEAGIAKLQTTFPYAFEQLKFAIVPDFTKHEAYHSILAGVTDIVHAASLFNLQPQDNAKGVPEPAIQGSLAILEAAIRYGPQVRQVINISSFAAIVDTSKGLRPGHTYSEKDWNPMTYDQAVATSNAECAIHTFSDQPPCVFGPYYADPDLGTLCDSVAALWCLFGAKTVPPTDFAGFVDVRDVTKAVMLALNNPAAAGRRFLLGASFDLQTAADIIRKRFMAAQERVPAGRPGYGKLESVYNIDGRQAQQVLGLAYTTLDTTLYSTVCQLLKAEEAEKGSY
ncbi:NADPH-dependent methylglyoxal reductase GRE2 [Fusarium odoratissimum]|uniref:NADPH-dependent methylglyoxal reductase GRE2 n=1 Tax=Fusarium oxysporum f. sp. cubense (strain race 4) TaxID=2502994 RepID=N1S8H9_FUSC4|nr:NADPH-dependent methylglyoxal reductase GRE2 [Fusarium odoratissimum]